ncbi:hypothetical protein K8R47_03145, partial [archaeon]|nr:hypothetical protein [archaeon]
DVRSEYKNVNWDPDYWGVVFFIVFLFVIFGLLFFYFYLRKKIEDIQFGYIKPTKKKKKGNIKKDDDPLRSYIKTCLRKGYSEDEVRIELFKTKWSKKKINKILEEFRY